MRPYVDDLENVPAGSLLVRRFPTAFADWPRDDDGVIDLTRKPRLTKQAFQLLDKDQAARFDCPGPGMSLIVLDLTSPQELQVRYAGEGLAIVHADTIRGAEGFGIDFRPTAQEDAHAVAFREDGGRNVPKGLARTLAEQASQRILQLPPPPA